MYSNFAVDRNNEKFIKINCETLILKKNIILILKERIK